VQKTQAICLNQIHKKLKSDVIKYLTVQTYCFENKYRHLTEPKRLRKTVNPITGYTLNMFGIMVASCVQVLSCILCVREQDSRDKVALLKWIKSSKNLDFVETTK